MQYLNPNLDHDAIGRALAERSRVQVRDFFAPQVALALAEAVEQIDWSFTYRDQHGDRRLTAAQLRALDAEQLAHLAHGIQHVARHEFQFAFLTDSLAEAVLEGQTDLLARFMRWMGSEDFLGLMRRMSGETGINALYAQATLYAPGHFLLAHDDHVGTEDRRLAYVLNLTRSWRPDWGGLLQFSDEQGDVTDTFFPHFNSLSLFRVPQTHFVSYVAPFAGSERKAITGWLIDATKSRATPRSV